MPVFIIFANDLHPDSDKRRRIYAESYHPSLDALAADLRGGPVVVRQIFVEPEGEKLVIKSGRDFMLTSSFIFNAILPDRDIVEYVEENPS